MQKHQFIPGGNVPEFCAYFEGDEGCYGRIRNPLHDVQPATTFTTPQIALVRQIVLRVIDDGRDRHAVKPWVFYSFSADADKAQRLDFVDRIQELIIAAAKESK